MAEPAMMSQSPAAPAESPQYPQVPVLDTGTAAAVLIVNVLLPGIGTIIAGVVGKMKLIGRGIAQLVLSLIIVGWVWAIVTGVQCLINAKK